MTSRRRRAADQRAAGHGQPGDAAPHTLCEFARKERQGTTARAEGIDQASLPDFGVTPEHLGDRHPPVR